MSPFQNILVGLSGTEVDGELLRYVAHVARTLKPSHLHFVHVLADGTPGAVAGTGAAAAATSFEAASEKIDKALEADLGELPEGVNAHKHILRGQRIDQLLAFAAENETDLILVGHRRSRSGRRSLARRLAMQAPCSVWMAPEGSEPVFDRILAPIDFSEESADALSLATELAAASGVDEIHALHVYFNEATTVYEEYDQMIVVEKDLAFTRFIAPINRHGVQVLALFEEGANVVNVINRLVERQGINLVVMGTRGLSRSAAVLLGSETEHTIIESRIPVLVFKHFGARLNLLQALLNKKFRIKSGPWPGVN